MIPFLLGFVLPFALIWVIICFCQLAVSDVNGCPVLVCVGIIMIALTLFSLMIFTYLWLPKVNSYCQTMYPYFFEALRYGYIFNDINLYPDIVK